MPRPHRSTSPAALLFLLIGTLGGGLGGALMGFRAAQRSGSVAPPPRSGPLTTPPDAAAAPPSALPPPAGVGPSPLSPPQDLGRDAGPAAALTEVCVEVCDVGEHRVAGALVSYRSAVAAPPAATRAVGELGVHTGALPFPEEVIARGGPPASPASRPAGGKDSAVLRTDSQGRACLRATGRVLISAAHDERSASVELDLGPSGGRSLGIVILRLAIPADALCRLAGPLDPAESSPEPVSDQPGGDIEGHVVDARGYTVAGVRIDAQVGSTRAVALSDSRGSFRLSGLPRGSLTLSAQRRGYAPLTLTRRGDEPRREVTLTLSPGGGIAGRLRDRDRGSLPVGATLSLQTGIGSQPVPLGKDGGFALTGLPVGSATLRARAPGFAPLSLPLDIPAGQSPDEITLRDLRIELEPAATLRGQVRSDSGSRGGVVITVTTADGTVCGRALTDDRGEFRLTDLPSGKLQIRAQSGPLTGEASVELRPAGQDQIELELR